MARHVELIAALWAWQRLQLLTGHAPEQAGLSVHTFDMNSTSSLWAVDNIYLLILLAANAVSIR
eukprot:6195128-Alexandrium_andersonii.AAC.1